MRVNNLALGDYITKPNAFGPNWQTGFVPATASFDVVWSAPVTRERLFEAANRYAEQQLALHAQYAAWTGLAGLAASVAELQNRLAAARNEGRCLLAIGWGAGFLSKSAAIGAEGENRDEHRKVLGALPYYERAIKSGLPFPKTRRIVFLKNKPATLPGWVELQVE